MQVLLVGGSGAIGRRVAAELARSADVERLVITSRDPRKAERVATLLGGLQGRVTGRSLDLRDPHDSVAAMRGHDVVVSCAGPFYELEIAAIRNAIDAGVNYVSLNDDHGIFQRVAGLHDAARDEGVTVVSGCGMSPGMTNLLALFGGGDLDVVDEIEVAVATSSQDGGGEAGTLHLLAMLAGPAPAIADRVLEEAPGGSGPKLVYFPEPVGWVETFRCGHPETFTLAAKFEGVRAVSFRLGLTERAVMDAVRAALGLGLLDDEARRRAWLAVAGPARPVLEALPPRGVAWSALRVDVHGRAGGIARTVTVGAADHLANLAAVPLTLAAIAVGSKAASAPGVRPPEDLFDAPAFLRGVRERGVSVARLEPSSV